MLEGAISSDKDTNFTKETWEEVIVRECVVYCMAARYLCLTEPHICRSRSTSAFLQRSG
jgi:hypothetical protein